MSATRASWLIWGANTGVGKTLLSAGLVRSAAAATASVGKSRSVIDSVLYLKPVQTGAPNDSDGRLVARYTSGMAHDVGTHAAQSQLAPSPSAAAATAATTPSAISSQAHIKRAMTLFAWNAPVSPHVAAASEGRGVDDTQLVEATRLELAEFFRGGPEPSSAGGAATARTPFALVETAGGVASPAPSGSLQCDALRPLNLPAILVGDGRLGGISATICAAESLEARGHAVDAVVLLADAAMPLGNADALRAHFEARNQALARHAPPDAPAPPPAPPILELPPPPPEGRTKEEDERLLLAWLDSAKGACDEVLDALMDREAARAAVSAAPATAVAGTEAEEGKAKDADAETAALLADDMRLLWHPYTSTTRPLPCLPVASAKGVRLTLADGTQLIDGMSSWWAAVHGYGVPAIDRAAKAQIDRMAHVMFGGLTHEPAVGLGRRLVELSPAPLEKVFLCDSGSVAIEVAIKMSLQYWRARGVEGRTRLLTVRGGYHGDTFGAMAVCDPVNGMHAQMFGGVLPPHLFAPRPAPRFGAPCTDDDVAELRRMLSAHKDEIAAVILEPIVQGAGGMRLYSAEYLRRVRRLCDEHGALLILDEIATGFGRTGKLFACEHAGISPDIMCVGKALTGGYMTMGATLATREVADGASGGAAAAAAEDGVVYPLMHGPTFMGNPLACSVANASIDLLRSSPWEANVARIERRLADGLAPVMAAAGQGVVSDVRVLGAIGVVEMAAPLDVASTQRLLASHGVWLRPFGKLLYTMPPFVIDDTDLDAVCGAMRAVVESAGKGRA